MEISHRGVLVATHARRHPEDKGLAALKYHPRPRKLKPETVGVPVIRKVDAVGDVSFAGARYHLSTRYRGEQVDVRMVGDSVQLSKDGELLRTHKAKHDPAKEHGAFAVPGGRPPKSPKETEAIGPSQHRYSLNGPWRRLRIAAGIPDVRIHDLRHTYASTAVGLGLGLPVLAGLLGQTQLATTQRYVHLDLDPRRRAAEAGAGRVGSPAADPPGRRPGGLTEARACMAGPLAGGSTAQKRAVPGIAYQLWSSVQTRVSPQWRRRQRQRRSAGEYGQEPNRRAASALTAACPERLASSATNDS